MNNVRNKRNVTDTQNSRKPTNTFTSEKGIIELKI